MHYKSYKFCLFVSNPHFNINQTNQNMKKILCFLCLFICYLCNAQQVQFTSSDFPGISKGMTNTSHFYLPLGDNEFLFAGGNETAMMSH